MMNPPARGKQDCDSKAPLTPALDCPELFHKLIDRSSQNSARTDREGRQGEES